MARGVVYDSLAALVDYLQQEEEDRAVPISALADVLGSEGAVGQTVRGLNDLRRQAGQGMMGLGEDIEGSRSMQARGDLEEMATIPGHMLANTLQAGGYLTQFGADDWQDVKRAAGAVADYATDPETWRERPGPLGESYPGLFYDAAEAVQPYLDKPYKVAQEMGVGEVLPGAGILAKLGMAVGPMARMGKGGNLLSDVTPDVDYPKTSEYIPGERISTRFPTAKGSTENPLAEKLIVDTDVVRRDEDLVGKTGGTLAKYQNIQREVAESGDPNKVIDAMKEHDKANLGFIFEQMPAEIRDRSMKWYDGANQIANQFKSRYNVDLEAASGVLAALSPQMDWFKNVNLAERVLDTVKNQSTMPWTAAMEEYITRKFYNEPANKRSKDWRPAIDAIRGKALQDIQEPIEKALWIRAYDETMRDRGYRVITPEGDFSSVVTKADGNPAKAGWGSFADIAKAVSVIDNPSPENVSRAMGGQHKVRNFYNNISDPQAPYGDVTMDTHAIAASLLRPLSGKSVEVRENLGGGPSSSVLGIEGSPYPVHADAYREIAAERGILPRQMQSVTWEGVRGLYSPEQKKNKAFIASIDDLFSQYREGQIALEDVQQKVLQIAGGITPPEWAD